VGMEILGVVASFATIVSGFGWLLDRNSKRTESMLKTTNTVIERVVGKVGDLESGFHDMRAEMPMKFVTKDDLLMHIKSEDQWHEQTNERLREIREELITLRNWSHR